ncbi:MaoC family dehydratase [uncultured Cohaesibacter sp.]|uniref:MaoC family dehydratase n=1 Tax=uncultured Cohaesibacter sp. TaxID=1002546 RepID=UPI0029C8A572|nr:MaoC family dehydratase [uncultured Cohaesibacter sp.]
MSAPLQGVQPQTVYYEDMQIGQKESFTHEVTEGDISAFANLTGDHNPVHVDKAYGEASRFGGNIAHGLYTASLFSAILGMRLPGPGAIYISQSLQFKAPVRPGDAVTISATVREKNDKGRRVTLDCSAEVDGLVVLSGEATVMAVKKPQS